MARINITGGRTNHWSLCNACKGSDAAESVTEIVELAKQHLAEAHAGDTRTHRIEMDMDQLVALTNAARTTGAADVEGELR